VSKGHRYQEISVREVALVPHPSLPDDQPYVLGLTEPERGIGCVDCNMPMEQALRTPCPGVVRPQLYDVEADVS
jgi:hypothetical protein